MTRLVLLFTLIGLKAHSLCPQLTGHYQCEFDGESWRMELSQREQTNGSTAYFQAGEFYALTDGAVREIPDTEDFRNGLTSSSCREERLVLELQGDFYEGEKKRASTNMEIINYLGRNGDLVQRQRGYYILNDGTEYPFDVIVTCERF